MKMSRQIITIVSVLLSALFLSSCRSKQDSAIEVAVLPPGTPAHIEGFLKEFRIVNQRGNGMFEVVLELPLTSPSGLTRYIAK